MSDQASGEKCPICGLKYVEKARIENFYSHSTETKIFCEDDHHVYIHEM